MNSPSILVLLLARNYINIYIFKCDVLTITNRNVYLIKKFNSDKLNFGTFHSISVNAENQVAKMSNEMSEID